MEVVVKKSEHRVNPRDVEHTDPTWERRRKVGEKRIREGKFKKFENEAQERDYLKKVDGNPANVPGLPVFYPPLTIRSARTTAYAKRDCSCGKVIYDELECMYCGNDLRKTEPYF